MTPKNTAGRCIIKCKLKQDRYGYPLDWMEAWGRVTGAERSSGWSSALQDASEAVSSAAEDSVAPAVS